MRVVMTVGEEWSRGRGWMRVNLWVRSTKVVAAVLEAAPTIRSPSQCPGTARSSTSGGRVEMLAPWTHVLAPRPGAPRRERGLRLVLPVRKACSFFSSSRRLPRLWT